MFETWRTIKIGTHKTVAELIAAIERKEWWHFDEFILDLLNKVVLAGKLEELELIVVTVGALGFQDGARREDIYKRAISLGLALCPLEVGPQLRLQYIDHPNGERLHVAMESIVASDGRSWVFDVGRDDGVHWLDLRVDKSDKVWDAARQFVFTRPKPPQ